MVYLGTVDGNSVGYISLPDDSTYIKQLDSSWVRDVFEIPSIAFGTNYEIVNFGEFDADDAEAQAQSRIREYSDSYDGIDENGTLVRHHRDNVVRVCNISDYLDDEDMPEDIAAYVSMSTAGPYVCAVAYLPEGNNYKLYTSSSDFAEAMGGKTVMYMGVIDVDLDDEVAPEDLLKVSAMYLETILIEVLDGR